MWSTLPSVLKLRKSCRMAEPDGGSAARAHIGKTASPRHAVATRKREPARLFNPMNDVGFKRDARKAVSAPFPASHRTPRRWRVHEYASKFREVLECAGAPALSEWNGHTFFG